MKRIVCIMLVFAFFLTFAACNSEPANEGKTETTTVLPPVVEESSFYEEFKDESGKTVIKVEVTLPQITQYAFENIKAKINNEAMNVFNEACDFAENNVLNASEFMRQRESDKPWKKKITFETTLLSNDYACFIVKESLSYYDSEVTPTWRTLCYDVKTGESCTLDTFTVYKDDPAVGFEAFLSDVVEPNLVNKYFYPQFIDNTVYENLDKLILCDDFYLTESGISFYIDGLSISPSIEGITAIDFTWDELAGYYEMPVS